MVCVMATKDSPSGENSSECAVAGRNAMATDAWGVTLYRELSAHATKNGKSGATPVSGLAGLNATWVMAALRLKSVTFVLV